MKIVCMQFAKGRTVLLRYVGALLGLSSFC